MIVYGLRGFTHHGGGRMLTVLSPEGRSSALAHLTCTDGLRTVARPGLLTQYHEVRTGSVKALVERYAIEVLSRAAWETTKAELGETAYC